MRKQELKEAIERVERYRETFGTESGKWVLSDLIKEAEKAGFHQDPYIHAFNSGVRETVSKISRFISDENYNQLKKKENEL